MESVKISYGDEGYDETHEAWLLNGSTKQFDRMHEWGGALYHCLDTSEEYPDFYLVSSYGPSTFRNDTPSAHAKPGWAFRNDPLRHGVLEYWFETDGLHVQMTESPNKLSPGETV